MELQADTATEAWKKALKLALNKGVDIKDIDGNICRELHNLIITVHYLEKDFSKPLAIMRSNDKWLYPSLDDIESSILDPRPTPVVEFAYGQRMFNYEGFDQVDDYVIPLLKAKHSTRRALVLVYNPLKDSRIDSELAPGLIYLSFRVLKDILTLTAHIRGNDLLFGLPADFYYLYLLQVRVAERTGFRLGPVTIISNSAYFFLDNLNDVKSLINKDKSLINKDN